LRSRRSRLLFAFLLAAVLALASGPGFRSRGQFETHYRKHGAEFGSISKEQYLSLAQTLRDAPAGKDILQSVRADRVVTKFDRRKGYFGAYNPDRTIRTFFIPNDGERYFQRQAKRQGSDE
jgi:pyocin large subunit-like protein